MGIWTWLCRVSSDVLRDSAPESLQDWAWLERHSSECIHIGRSWHALHVVLTGSADEAEPPASWVAYDGGTRIEWFGLAGAVVLSSPKEVQFTAAYLQYEAHLDTLLAERYPALFYGADALYVYSFGSADGPDLVQSGAVEEAFRRLQRFYADAAAAGEAVVKRRG